MIHERLITEFEAKKLNKDYNFKKCELFHDTLYIDSKFDSWIAEDKGTHILLKHKTKGKNKHRLHKQRKYKDLPYMFQSIYEHDLYTAKQITKPKCRMTELFNVIEIHKNNNKINKKRLTCIGN